MFKTEFVVSVQCSSTRSCAVMVWIHGGGFVMLDGSPNSFGPKFLMDYDVILVSPQFPVCALKIKEEIHFVLMRQ